MGKSRRSGQNPLYRSRPDAVAESRGRPSGREPARVRAERAEAICRRLADLYPDSRCSLDFRSPFELLIATILSAQCTDKRVNLVTPVLFARWPDPVRMAAADGDQLEEVIHSTGFFRSKARNIRGCCQRLVDRHGGQVPETLAELVALPGVGRKTANVVMNVAYGEATIAVDTHIFRVANRTGLGRGKTPLAVELKLLKSVPETYRQDAHHWLILHGRYICTARRPHCEICPITDLCEFKDKTLPR